MACTPQDLVTAASKFQGIPTGMQTNIATAVACQLAGIPADPQALVEASKCIECGKTEPILLAIAAVCNLSSGGSTFTITAPSDPDAFAFWEAWTVQCFNNGGCVVDSSSWTPGGAISLPLSCAALCGTTQASADAVNTLVTSLKSAGLWNLLDVIYPFMGGTAASCALNLKDPNSFAITWHGGVTFSSAGATADGLTGYGDTGWTAADAVHFTLNSGSIGICSKNLDLSSVQVESGLIGSENGIGFNATLMRYAKVSTSFTGAINGGGCSIASGVATGTYILSRESSSSVTLYLPDGSTNTQANAPTGLFPNSLYVLGWNFDGAVSVGVKGNYTFSFAGAGLSGAQVTSLSTIITTFETALGRA